MPSDTSFPLSPVQQGMLYHHLSAPHSGVDIEQMVAVLREPLDAAALQGAWDRLVNRHGAFRGSFEWENRPHPVQVEHEHVHVPWEEHDLRSLPPEERRKRLDDFLDQDRRRGFDFQVAPLARATLFRGGDDEWTLVWTFHHILADGHSYPALIREAFAWYAAVRNGKELTFPQPRPYREFIQWLGAHLSETQARAEGYWRETLQGFSSPTPLPGVVADRAGEPGVDEKRLRLSASTTAALTAFARTHALTMNSLVQGAWALALAAHAGGEDVVFGVTRSGRRSAPAGAEDMVGLLINTLPLRVRLRPESSVLDWLKTLRASQKGMRDFEHTPLVDVQRWSDVPPGSPLFESILVFTPRLIGAALRELGGPWADREIRFLEQTNYPLTLFAYNEKELLLKLAYARGRFSDAAMERCLELLGTLLEALPVDPDRRLADLPLVAGLQKQTLLADWNATSKEYAADRCIHDLFEAQVQRTPHAVAAVFRNDSVTYAELNRQANRIARRLHSLGVGPGHFVGVFVPRSIDLVAALLGALKAGAAYIPMDPAYPRERLWVMLKDAGASAVLTVRELAPVLPSQGTAVVLLDVAEASEGRPEPLGNVASGVRPQDVAYAIFTSGSSGRPKGVLVEHRNVVNLFAGIDDLLEFKEPGTWLAVTSTSFDISVLELFWTLARGFKVVVQEDAVYPGPAGDPPRAAPRRKMDFSLFYFAADAGESGGNRYRLLLEGAQYADQHGFAAIWTPERHFHPFGGLYPNPSVTSAAIAAITSRIQIRAGSVVLPLHDPIRVAEEWAVVDNLSQGRVGLSFASGWHANDFALSPHNFRERKEVMLRGIDTIRRLWRGEAVKAVSGSGEEIDVRIFPAPVQRDPPIWLTAAGNVETFRAAGRMGANLLTNLLGQKAEELADKIAAYRQARRENGHPGRGCVTLMLHTFVGPDLDQVRAKVRKPFLDYLRTSTDLIQKARWDCPAFATRGDRRIGPADEGDLTDADMQALLDHAFDRYFSSSGLFGTPDMCLEMVDRLSAIGVDEIACLIDFGVDGDSVLEGLQYLNEVRRRSDPAEAADYSIPGQLRCHKITHLQCTPSLARMLAAEPDALDALRPLKKLLIGGEALPPSLAERLAAALDGDLINVYGPTETTVWSTADVIGKSGGPVTIGRPLANTQVYVLDRQARPVPIGVPGELYIGGDGVARGYLNRPDLTTDRFVRDPFSAALGARLYRTGDLVRYREDGRIEYLGRLDHQVKIRGYRIELGEIEAVLAGHPAVRESVVVARENGGDDRALVAYVGATERPPTADEAVAQWRAVWDAAYAPTAEGRQAPADPTLNTSGWVSSYTGQLLPDSDMRDWVGHTVGRILALHPRRVLEIGFGTGMLLFRIAPHCEHYHGLDVSPHAVQYVEAEAARQGLRNVTLRQGAADDLAGLEPGAFDCVVLNSVIQYFPSADYLVGVLERIVPLVREGGAIFIGDVRSLPHNEAFHTSVELEQAPASMSAAELRQRIRLRLERENELVFDPALFHALAHRLPRIRCAEVHLKRGRSRNELTCFRYDVMVGVGGASAEAAPPTFESGEAMTLAGVRERLASGAPMVALAGIPNERVASAVRAKELLAGDDCPETVEAIRLRLAAAGADGVDPEDLATLEVPYDVQLTWSERAPDRFDAVFRHPSASSMQARLGVDSILQKQPWDGYTNRPGARPAGSSLARELKEMAKARLPDYMVPATVVVLESLPRTPNGKIDRKALPEPGLTPALASVAYRAPQTELEKTIALVWQELLKLERVGVHDRFVDLGANSLVMVQANSHLRTALRRELTLVELFQYPTVSALAAHLSRHGDDAAALDRSAERGQARGEALQRRRLAARAAAAPAKVPPGR